MAAGTNDVCCRCRRCCRLRDQSASCGYHREHHAFQHRGFAVAPASYPGLAQTIFLNPLDRFRASHPLVLVIPKPGREIPKSVEKRSTNDRRLVGNLLAVRRLRLTEGAGTSRAKQGVVLL